MSRSSIVNSRLFRISMVFAACAMWNQPASARQEVQVEITGVVVDSASNSPIDGASIELGGETVAVSDNVGRFRITLPLTVGISLRVVATRIGYQRGERAFVVQSGTGTVDLIFQLVPIPIQLREINIEGEATEGFLANLAGFNRRKMNQPGHFFTRADIQRVGAQRLTDVVRRVPGSIIYSAENVFLDLSNPESAQADPMEQRTSITFQRSGVSRGVRCEALVFLNDVQVSDRNIDWLVDPQSIVGLEVYNGSSQVPAEYNKQGASCGVVVVWTDAPVRQRPGLVNSFEVGGTFSARMGGGLEGERIGIQMRLPIGGIVEFHPSFYLIIGSSSQGDAGWQLMTTFKAKPLGRATPWYVGTGMTIVKDRWSFFDSFRSDRENTRFMPVGLTGFSHRLGPVRPFVELQMIDPFGDGEGFVAAGLTIFQR